MTVVLRRCVQINLLTYEKTRSARSLCSIHGRPLVDDENDEVAKDAEQEDQLRYELAEDAQSVVEIPAHHAVITSRATRRP